MMDGMSVRADGRDVSRLALRPADDCQRRAGKVLAQHKVEFADLGHRPVQAQMQDALTHGRREGTMHVRQHARNWRPLPAISANTASMPSPEVPDIRPTMRCWARLDCC